MIKVLYLLVFITTSHYAQAQSVVLKKWTLSSAGTVYYSAQNKLALSQTIGQSSLVGHFGTGRVTLLQGFQHPFIQNQTANLPRTKTMSVFPNPSVGKITVNILSDQSNQKTSVSLYSASGILVSRQLLKTESNSFDMDYTSIPKGAYSLRIIGSYTGTSSVLLILK